MIYLAALVSGLLIVLILVRLRHIFFGLVTSALKLLDTLLVKDQSDVSLIVSLQLKVFKSLILVILILGVCYFLFILPLAVSEEFFSNPASADWKYFLALSVGSILPFLPFRKSKEKSDYSDWSKVLHRIILDNYQLGKTLFDLDRRWFGIKESHDKVVYVSGLARAGSTALTTQLFEGGDFYSLSYANMPFLMAPNIWSVFYKPGRNAQMKERSHGDKVMFGQQSVEALEEYFWKVNLDDSYIGDKVLSEHEPDDEVLEKFALYRSMIAKGKNASHYLAKNNNHLLRYGSLKKKLPEHKVIFLFRDPVQHAMSLLNQHRRYIKMQGDDPFVLEYMNWLGHHEFGENHKPICVDCNANFEYTPESINYWIEVWLDYYQAYLNTVEEDEYTVLVEYDDFAGSPDEVYNALSRFLEMPLDVKDTRSFPIVQRDAEGIDEAIHQKALGVYQRLVERKLEI